MIEFTRGNIMDSDADYLVIPVNCVGAPGKGLAAQWAEQADPKFVDYYKVCCLTQNPHRERLAPGDILTYADSTFVLAATKDHWLFPSKIEWIECILENLVFAAIPNWIGKSVAVPKLGCGLGQLRWSDVRPMFIYYLTQSPAKFIIYE